MFDKLNAVEQKYEEILARLGTAELQSDPSEYRKQAKAASEMQPLIDCFREYKIVAHDLAQTEELANAADADMRELAQAELKSLAAFNSADFFSIYDKESETLGGDLNGKEELRLKPGETVLINHPPGAKPCCPT